MTTSISLRWLFVVASSVSCCTGLALTALPYDELEEGRVFDASSPLSQKMTSVLCFGRDPSFCSSLKQPPRYYGMGFQCDWPELFSENMTPDDQPNRKRFVLPGSALQVGKASQGQTCFFKVNFFVPEVLSGSRDRDDLMAYVEWEFEKEPIAGLGGKKEANKVMLPYFLNSKRDGSHFKNPWDERTPKNYQSNMTMLPSRVGAIPQNSWMTLIINGQVIDKIEVPLTDKPVKWQVYDWRKKVGKTYELRHGTSK